MDFWATEVVNLNFLEALVKLLTRTALLAILVWILELWLRSRPARFRQALWLFFLAILALWPLLVAIAPALPLAIGTYTSQGYRGVPLPPDPLQPIWQLENPQHIEAYSSLSWGTLLVVAYWMVSGLLLIRLLVSQSRVSKLVAASSQISPDNLTQLETGLAPLLLTRVRESSELLVPVTAGLLRPSALLPASWRLWPDAKLRAVLIHELTHVAHRDTLFQFLASAVTSFFWFHPCAWLAGKRIAALAEEACDDAALARQVNPVHYSEWLLEMGSAMGVSRQPRSVISMARPSRLRGRISRILDSRPKLPDIGRGMRVALVVTGLAAVFLSTSVYLTARVSREMSMSKFRSRPGTLTAAEVSQLETHLKSEPEDREARNKLFFHYQINGSGSDLTRHYFWMAERHPESKGLQRANQDFSILSALRQNNSYEPAKLLWHNVAARSQSPEALVNAAAFIQNRDTGEAYEIYRRAYELAPTDPAVIEAFAAFLATGAEQNLAYSSGRQRGYWIPIDFGMSQSARLKHELETSSDPNLLAATAHYLTLQLDTGGMVFKHDDDARRFGFSLYDRAEKIDPGNPHWASMRAKSQQVVPPSPKGHSYIIGASMEISHLTVTPAELRDHVLQASAGRVSGVGKLLGIRGEVRFEVRVDNAGQVQSAEVLNGNWFLRGAAAKALKGWRFAPFYRDGIGASVISEAKVPVV